MTSATARLAAALEGSEPSPVSVPADEWVPVLPVPDSAPVLDVNRMVDGQRRTPDAAWRYTDANGRTVGYAVRWNLLNRQKDFRFATWCRSASGAEGWKLKHLPAPRPLYGLDRLAASPDAPVAVVEGEKAADAAARVFQKSVCVTSPAGANAAGKADWSPLAGRRVLIIPDHDEPGRRYAQDVAKILGNVGAASVSIAILAGLAAQDAAGNARDPVAGFDVADALDEGWAPDELRRLIVASAVAVEVPAVRQYVQVHGFAMSDEGLFVERITGKGESQRVDNVMVSAPFEVLGRARDPQGEGWARWIRWADPDGRSHVAMVSDGDLQGDTRDLAKRLAGRGLYIARGGAGSLANYINAADVPDRVTVVPSTGWHTIDGRAVFVLPNGIVSDGSNVICEATGASPYEANGSLADWQTGVGALVADHRRGVLAVSAAFAGPLLHLTGSDGGGLNLYGPSSCGKSTLLLAAASVWGKGALPGFARPWRATANALEATAALHTDTLLALDELGLVDPRDLAAAVYSLSGGTGKGRAGRDGGLRGSARWRVIILSTGEMPITAKIQEERGRRAQAGQTVRLLDVPADAGAGYGCFDGLDGFSSPGDLSDAIKRAARSHYGTAGPAFARHVQEAGAGLAATVGTLIDAFTAAHVPPKADGQVKRAAGRLALIGAAGELAIEWQIAPWSAGSAFKAATDALAAWINQRGGTEAAEATEAVARVRGFIEAHGEARFGPCGSMGSDARPVINRAGWRRGSDDARQWLILPGVWRREVCAGLDPQHVAAVLADRGMLRPDPAGKFKRAEKTPEGSKRVYVVTSKILEGDG